MPHSYKLLEVRDLNTSFKIDAGRVLAVNGVSFTLEKGKILGIVGESGSGKSVTAYSIMGILDKNGRVDRGKIIFNGTDLLKLSEPQMRDIRGNKISIIFQDAMTSLNPTWSIGNQLREAILTHSKDPVKVAASSLENDVLSDKQRIELMQKGLKHHPNDLNLKSDLEALKKKLSEDEKKLKTLKESSLLNLKKNEKAMMEQYKKEVPSYNKEIKNAINNYFKNFFKLNKKPTIEDTFIHSHYQRHISNITSTARALETAKSYYDIVKANYLKIKEENNPNKNALIRRAIKYLYRAKKAIRIAKGEYNRAKRAMFIYRFKFKYDFIHEPRKNRRLEIKNAITKKRDLYWTYKSKYRETKYSANLKALDMLKKVGITEPKKRLKQYPFELSGGMLQRCMIAMALIQKPDILIADEPTTALDVTIQAQILELLKDLQKEYGMAIIIITHDLGVVAQICDEVNIMYAGRIVERGTVDDVFYNPQHEYTKGLLKSMPKLNQPKGLLDPIKGNPVDLFCLPKGCAFASRCKECMKICIDKYPEEILADNSGHKASCWALVKKLHDERVIDVTNQPTGVPLNYNGAIIREKKKTKKLRIIKHGKEGNKEKRN